MADDAEPLYTMRLLPKAPSLAPGNEPARLRPANAFSPRPLERKVFKASSVSSRDRLGLGSLADSSGFSCSAGFGREGFLAGVNFFGGEAARLFEREEAMCERVDAGAGAITSEYVKRLLQVRQAEGAERAG